MKKFIPVIIFLIILVFLYLGLGKDTKKIPSPFIGKPFPSLASYDYYNGDLINIREQFKGWTLVNFWASWCVACRAEHPQLMKIAKSGVVKIIGVNYKDDKKDGLKFLKHGGNPFDLLLYDRNGNVGLNLGVYAMPESFLVDKNGNIVHKHLGSITAKIWQDEFLSIINK